MTQNAIETTATRVEKEPEKEQNIDEKAGKTTEKQTINPLTQVAVKQGYAAPVNYEQMRTMATVWIQGKGVPKSYTSWQQVVAGLSFARGLGLPLEISSLKNIAVINGNPSLFGDLPKKIAEDSGELEFFDEYLIDSDRNRIPYIDSWEQIYASVCVVKRKGKEKKTFTFTCFQAEQGIKGIAAIWKGYFDVMLIRKVRARALNSEFADILGGRSIVEYEMNFAPDAHGMEQKLKDVTPNSVAGDMEFLT